MLLTPNWNKNYYCVRENDITLEVIGIVAAQLRQVHFNAKWTWIPHRWHISTTKSGLLGHFHGSLRLLTFQCTVHNFISLFGFQLQTNVQTNEKSAVHKLVLWKVSENVGSHDIARLSCWWCRLGRSTIVALRWGIKSTSGLVRRGKIEYTNDVPSFIMYVRSRDSFSVVSDLLFQNTN